MAWVESHQSLGRHRKTLEVVAVLHVDRHKLLGHLHELWWWGLDNADPDGLVGQVPCEALAAAAGWPLKDARRFADALQSAGFLDATAQGYVLHDWFDYTGKLNTQRELRKASNRESQRRRRDRLSAAGQHDVTLTVSTGHDDIADSQHSTGPTQPDQPPVGPLSASSPARARGAPRAAPRPAPVQDEPSPLRHGQQQCPLCPEVFPDNDSVRVHLDTSPRHKVRPAPDDLKAPPRVPPNTPIPVAVLTELQAIAQRPTLTVADLPPDLAAAHERFLARERSQPPDTSA